MAHITLGQRQSIACRYVWSKGVADRVWIDEAPIASAVTPDAWLDHVASADLERLLFARELCQRTGSASVSYRLNTPQGTVWIGERMTAAQNAIQGLAWAARLDLADVAGPAMALLPAAVYLYDYQADQVLEANAYAARLVGLSVEELNQQSWKSFLHAHDLTELPRHRRHLRRTNAGEALPTTFRLAAPNGGYSQLSGREAVVARDPSGQPWLVLGVAQDSSDSARLERELLRSVLHDPITQLPNRMVFLERVDIASRTLARRPALFALMLISIERLGMVNEGLGRAVGDQMLARIARRLEECVLDEDLVSRFAGDEYGILVEDSNRERAQKLADRIQTALSSPFELDGATVHVGTKIGITLSGRDQRTAATLVQEAEVALSTARQSSAPFQFYDGRMVSQAAAHLHLDAELRRALEREELTLLYQPIYSLSQRTLLGFEGLMRWQHPTRGLISPADFLGNAGTTGLIVPIGYYAVEAACKQLAAWSKLPGKFSISVNIDGQQFSQPDLSLRIAAIMARYRVDPRRLKLEITETVITQTSSEVSAQLEALRLLGVGILLDDFGTGFSSLGRLRDLPIDTLKIDKVFIHRAGRDEESDEIIRAVVTMARNLNIETVAEGIESHSQAALLSREGCDAGQGFYFYPPLEAAEAARLIRR